MVRLDANQSISFYDQLVLMEAIRGTIESGRAVALAIKSERPDDPEDEATEYDPIDLTGTEIGEGDIEEFVQLRG